MMIIISLEMPGMARFAVQSMTILVIQRTKRIFKLQTKMIELHQDFRIMVGVIL